MVWELLIKISIERLYILAFGVRLGLITSEAGLYIYIYRILGLYITRILGLYTPDSEVIYP